MGVMQPPMCQKSSGKGTSVPHSWFSDLVFHFQLSLFQKARQDGLDCGDDISRLLSDFLEESSGLIRFQMTRFGKYRRANGFICQRSTQREILRDATELVAEYSGAAKDGRGESKFLSLL